MPKNSQVKMGSNRNFGLVFFAVFAIISLWPLIDGQQIRSWSLYISLVFLFLGLINSNFLTPLNKLWFKFALLLGKIVSPIVMGIVFFLVVTPTGIIMRIIGKDLLGRKFNKNKKTYWINREKSKSTMKQQF